MSCAEHKGVDACYDDQAAKAEPWYEARLPCDHVCLLERGHEPPHHVYGYSLPPAEDRARELRSALGDLCAAAETVTRKRCDCWTPGVLCVFCALSEAVVEARRVIGEGS